MHGCLEKLGDVHHLPTALEVGTSGIALKYPCMEGLKGT